MASSAALLELDETIGASPSNGPTSASSTRGDLDLRDAEVERRALAHAALAERRQHVGDVVEERPVRPDDEHAVAGEPATVLEQEVGGAVQGDRGLAGARTALHDQRLVDRRPDHDVLLGLDRGDDLAHRTRARGADLGQHRVGDAARRRRPRRGRRGARRGRRSCVALVEREPPAEHDAERVDRRWRGRTAPRSVPANRRRPDRASSFSMWRRPMYHCSIDVPIRRRLVDAAEEVAGTR